MFSISVEQADAPHRQLKRSMSGWVRRFAVPCLVWGCDIVKRRISGKHARAARDSSFAVSGGFRM